MANLANPMALASVGALMEQHAMQQAMDEIRDYLAKIDERSMMCCVPRRTRCSRT